MSSASPLVIAVPKGRILEELSPLFAKADLHPEPKFFDESARELSFKDQQHDIMYIRVRSFDVATFVAYGAAQVGIAGSDVLDEFDYPDIYAPLDLGIGHCRMALAAPVDAANDVTFWSGSHIRVATKYLNTAKRWFASKGIQAECIKLNGAVELAPTLGLADRIVDLVSSGATLKANGLAEVAVLAPVSSRLVVHRGAYKTQQDRIRPVLEGFERASKGA